MGQKMQRMKREKDEELKKKGEKRIKTALRRVYDCLTSKARGETKNQKKKIGAKEKRKNKKKNAKSEVNECRMFNSAIGRKSMIMGKNKKRGR